MGNYHASDFIESPDKWELKKKKKNTPNLSD